MSEEMSPAQMKKLMRRSSKGDLFALGELLSLPMEDIEAAYEHPKGISGLWIRFLNWLTFLRYGRPPGV